jgi:hypothetical protein
MLNRPSDNGHTGVRRHLLFREPGPNPLGPPPTRDGSAPMDVGIDQGRGRSRSDRD